MKSSLAGILRKCAFAFAFVAATLMLIPLGAAPALAITRGAVTPVLTVQAAGKYNWNVTWGANMTGWKRGTLTITAKFYVNGAFRAETSHDCTHSTFCEVPNTTTQFSSPKAWSVVATGCGPGGCETETKSG
jgi:hypothetical protein